MCGIAGFVNDMPIDTKCPVLKRMTDIIAHRGPDSEGHYIDEHAALGHRRLSIIDLGGGKQPIYNEDGSLVITFNGEIYNYQPLREPPKATPRCCCMAMRSGAWNCCRRFEACSPS